MRTARVLVDGARALARNRLRAFFMMSGTFVGVAALTVVVALGRNTQDDMLQRMDRMLSGSSILLRAGGAQIRGGAHGGPTSGTLSLEDVAAIERAVGSVLVADAFIMGNSSDVEWDGRSASIAVQGHTQDAEAAWSRSVTRGSYFTAADVTSAARVALVGETVVRELFAGRDPVGEQIRIGSAPFQVLGVLATVGVDPHGIDKDNEIIIPVTTLMRRVLNTDEVTGAKLLMEPGTDLDMAVLEVADVLRARHSLGPGVPNDFAMFTPLQATQMIRSANRVFTVFLPLAASVSLLIGGLVVANLMFASVSERRAEIGLRRAVGARTGDIRLQFLVEAVAVTAFAGVLALGAGWSVVQLMGMHGGPAAQMPWSAAALGVGASVAVGVLSGIAPAQRAASLDPVQTLR